MKRNVSTVIGVLLAGVFALAQDTKPLTNDEIVQMLKAGFSDETIVTTIQTQPTAFDSSASALITLKSSGVSEAVIAAMLNSAKGASSNGGRNDNQPVLNREPGKRTDGQLPAIYVEEVSSEGSQMASSDTTLEAIKTLQGKSRLRSSGDSSIRKEVLAQRYQDRPLDTGWRRCLHQQHPLGRRSDGRCGRLLSKEPYVNFLR
jgi:hypothetical protein